MLRINAHCRQRVYDAKQHMTQLQTGLDALQQQHQSKVAQMDKDKESLLANIRALEDQSAQLQDKLDVQRCACCATCMSSKAALACATVYNRLAV